MARRSEDWNMGLSKDLREAAFAREFLLASIDEGVDLSLRSGRSSAPWVSKSSRPSTHGQSERAPRDQPPPQSNAGHAQSSPEAVQATPESGTAHGQAAPDCSVTRP